MTRPMTQQPQTDEELTNAVQEANKTIYDDVPEDIKNHPLTKDSLKEDEGEDENSDGEKLEELREFRQTVRDEGNDELGVYGEPQTDEEQTMEVAEDGETQEFTREEWEARRDTRTQTWNRLERNGGVYVRVARWFNDAEVNKVKVGRGFYGEKIDETEKALQFKVEPNTENYTIETMNIWVPKKAVQTFKLI